MPRSKQSNEKSFSPDWKSIGIGIAIGMILMGLIIAAGGRLAELSFLGVKIGFPTPAPPSTPSSLPPTDLSPIPVTDHQTVASQLDLVSISYISNDYDPRVVDLRTSSTDGITVTPGPFALFDLWVNISSAQPGDEVEAEIYLEPALGDGLIGVTPPTSVESETIKLNRIAIAKFPDPNNVNAWALEQGWERIKIYTYLYRNVAGQRISIATSATTIALSKTGNSWFFYPPYANLISVVYQVNDDEKQILDLRTAPMNGINVRSGDQLRIWEIWCRAKGTNADENIFVEGSLNSSYRYDLSTRRQSHFRTFSEGVYNLLSDVPFEWTITPDSNAVVFYLARDEGDKSLDRGILIDKYFIPFSTEAPDGLEYKPLP